MTITYQGVLTFPAEKTQELKTDILEEAQRRASGFRINPKIADAIQDGFIYFDGFKNHVRKDFTIIAKAAQEHDIPIEGEIRYYIISDDDKTTEGILIVKDGFLEDLMGDDALLHRLSDRALIREIQKRTAENEETVEVMSMNEFTGKEAIVAILEDDDLAGTYFLARKQEI